MQCVKYQQWLLRLEPLDEEPPELQAHLADCPECRGDRDAYRMCTTMVRTTLDAMTPQIDQEQAVARISAAWAEVQREEAEEALDPPFSRSA